MRNHYFKSELGLVFAPMAPKGLLDECQQTCYRPLALNQEGIP